MPKNEAETVFFVFFVVWLEKCVKSKGLLLTMLNQHFVRVCFWCSPWISNSFFTFLYFFFFLVFDLILFCFYILFWLLFNSHHGGRNASCERFVGEEKKRQFERICFSSNWFLCLKYFFFYFFPGQAHLTAANKFLRIKEFVWEKMF